MTATRGTDPEIARLFEAERLADEAAAPDLDALLARPARRQESEARGIRRVALGAAAFLAATVVVVVLRSSSPRHPTVPEAAAALSPAATELASWKAPTDALLRTPGSDLWTSVPEIANPTGALETGIRLATTKGVER